MSCIDTNFLKSLLNKTYSDWEFSLHTITKAELKKTNLKQKF